MRRRRRILQAISDLNNGSLEGVTILDLGSLEGHFSFEFAARGATVLGIEGRQSNVDKALEMQKGLDASRVRFVRDDVRNLSKEKYGEFDVVFAGGILYHLTASDGLQFLRSISEVCRRFAVIDTHISFKDETTFEHQGVVYSGKRYVEFETQPSKEEEEKSNWSSIGNTESFWMTHASLLNALTDVGFTSIYECHVPTANDLPPDRITLVAFKRTPVNLTYDPLPEAMMRERLPELAQQNKGILERVVRRISQAKG